MKGKVKVELDKQTNPLLEYNYWVNYNVTILFLTTKGRGIETRLEIFGNSFHYNLEMILSWSSVSQFTSPNQPTTD